MGTKFPTSGALVIAASFIAGLVNAQEAEESLERLNDLANQPVTPLAPAPAAEPEPEPEKAATAKTDAAPKKEAPKAKEAEPKKEKSKGFSFFGSKKESRVNEDGEEIGPERKIIVNTETGALRYTDDSGKTHEFPMEQWYTLTAGAFVAGSINTANPDSEEELPKPGAFNPRFGMEAWKLLTPTLRIGIDADIEGVTGNRALSSLQGGLAVEKSLDVFDQNGGLRDVVVTLEFPGISFTENRVGLTLDTTVDVRHAVPFLPDFHAKGFMGLTFPLQEELVVGNFRIGAEVSFAEIAVSDSLMLEIPVIGIKHTAFIHGPSSEHLQGATVFTGGVQGAWGEGVHIHNADALVRADEERWRDAHKPAEEISGDETEVSGKETRGPKR